MIEEKARQEMEAATEAERDQDEEKNEEKSELIVPDKIIIEKPPSRLLHAAALASLASEHWSFVMNWILFLDDSHVHTWESKPFLIWICISPHDVDS